MTRDTSVGRRAGRHPVRRAVEGGVARAVRQAEKPLQRERRSQFATLGVPKARLVFLGDSISQFGDWDEWFPGRPVLNRGVGGETSAEVATRLDTAIDEPLGVLLLIGTNDVSFAVPADRIVANVREILAGIERHAAGTPVVVQSVMPRQPRFRDEIRTVNRGYQDLVAASGPHVRYLDLWPALATPQGALRPAFTFEGKHLNGPGYRAWVQELLPVVAALHAR